MADDRSRAVLARLPAYQIKNPTRMKEIRAQWDHHCARILHDEKLKKDQKIEVAMAWLAKGRITEYVVGELLFSKFIRPLPVGPTEEKKKDQTQKRLVNMVYKDDLPHLRAVNKVVNERLETAPHEAEISLAKLDARDTREQANPGSLFEEFVRNIEAQVALEYQRTGEPFADAAE